MPVAIAVTGLLLRATWFILYGTLHRFPGALWNKALGDLVSLERKSNHIWIQVLDSRFHWPENTGVRRTRSMLETFM